MENNNGKQLLKDCILSMNFERLIFIVDNFDKKIEKEYTQKSISIEGLSENNIVYVDGKLEIEDLPAIISPRHPVYIGMQNRKALKGALENILAEYLSLDKHPDIENNISTSIRKVEYGGALLLVDFLTYINNIYQEEFDTLSSIKEVINNPQLTLNKK